jgi:glycosyltransferase 2 family protein
MGVYLTLVLMAAWGRWYLLLRLAGIKAGAGRVFSLFMIGLFFNSLIPGGTGGDLVKGYYLFRENREEDKALALTTIAMDRIIGLYALLCVAVVMAAINVSLWWNSATLRINSLFYAGVFVAFSAIVALFFSPWSEAILKSVAAPGSRIGRMPGGGFIRKLFGSLSVYRNRPGSLVLPLLLGISVDCGLILLYYFSARALGMELPLRVHGFVVPTLTMINGIPISPSGLGVGEAAGKVVYGSLGVTSGGGEVLVLVHLVILAVSLAGAPFYLLYRGRKAEMDAP